MVSNAPADFDGAYMAWLNWREDCAACPPAAPSAGLPYGGFPSLALQDATLSVVVGRPARSVANRPDEP